MNEYRSEGIDDMDEKIRGIPASKGRKTGKVAFFDESDPYKHFDEITILVAEYIPPNIVSLDNNVQGLLIEESSILCHAACIARELQIPCIVGIDSLFDILYEGEAVEIIGEAGEIRRV